MERALLDPHPIPSPPRAARWRLRLLLLCLLALALAACHPSQKPQRSLFDDAEAAYRSGNYDIAIKNYEAFEKAFPDHPLAPLAKQRIGNIEREFESVMARKQGSKPIYLRPVGLDESEQVSGGVVHALPPSSQAPPAAAQPLLRSAP
jgi:hypothetical protein